MKNILNQNSKDNLATKIDWKVIQSEMKNKFGLEIYESWLRKIDFVDEFTNYILLKVSTRFIRDWITSRYLDQILQIVKGYKKDIRRIEFLVSENKNNICPIYNVVNYSYNEIPTTLLSDIDTIYIDPPYFKKNSNQ